MNNYKTMECPMEEETMSVDIPPLSAMTDKATNMVVEALTMAYRINQHLFGVCEPSNEKANEPKCYRDVLEMQMVALDKLNYELSKIMKGIGI